MDEMNIKVKGSTLIETIVAMVIILVCAGIGLTIFTNTTRDFNESLMIKARLKADSLSVETRNNKEFFDASLEINGLQIERTLQQYSKSRTIKILTIRVLNSSGREICNQKELVVLK